MGDTKWYCHSGGMLLGAMHPLRDGSDPAVREDEAAACGALQCAACGRPVRTWDHYRWTDETPARPYVLPPEDPERDRAIAEETRQAYDTGTEYQHLQPLKLARAYFCRCTRVTLVGGAIDLGDVECTLRWRCGGHASGTELVLIPEGEFLMGCAPGDVDFPQHRVFVSAFLIGKFEVTNAEFRRFYERDHFRTDAEVIGSAFVRFYGGETADASWMRPTGLGSNIEGLDAHPVVQVSWRDAVAYCAWLRKTTGRPFRLPTEAEWEKAARGPRNIAFGHGEVQDPLKANVRASGHRRPIAFGSYPPNGYGLHDTDGNVAEWVADSYAEGYHLSVPPRDPRGPAEAGIKLLKGDSYVGGTVAHYCRNWLKSHGSMEFIGFRVACDVTTHGSSEA